MRRATKIVPTAVPHKPVSFAIERVFPAGRASGEAAANVSATPRVRDSLVLRLVAKKKPAGRSANDEREAR